MSDRLFVALELPAAARDALVAYGARAVAADPAALRAVDAASLHLTLAFLGDRPRAERPALAALVRAVAAPVPGLAIGAPLWLAPRRPHVLAVAIADAGGTLGVARAALVAGLREAIGFAPERRAFLPHVTVARVRRGAAPRRALPDEPPALAFAGAALTLMRSHLGGGPARYEALERVVLAGG